MGKQDTLATWGIQDTGRRQTRRKTINTHTHTNKQKQVTHTHKQKQISQQQQNTCIYIISAKHAS
jgi:hypothetical protein